MFKRYVLWTFRVTGHVPGFKRYSRFMIPRLERNFWPNYLGAWAVNTVVVTLQLVAFARLSQWLGDRAEQAAIKEMADLEAKVDAAVAEQRRLDPRFIAGS